MHFKSCSNFMFRLSSRRRFISTIFALSSGFGKCGVAVIRISGPDARNAAESLAGTLPPPRVASLRKFKDPVTSDLLDQGLLLWFPGPRSFTGEDCCEFQVHGGLAVITAMLNALSKIKNLRPAEHGEFTKRAFYSGKFDLTSVEGVADLINAETENQRKQAVIQMEGTLFNIYSDWVKSLTKILAKLEAYIDFDEDENLGSSLISQAKRDLNELKSVMKDGCKGERLREGVNMTILGAPNVGKSSLLNLLTCQPAAIVSSVPGTTRDLIKTKIDINGYPVNITDTAGLRHAVMDPVELEGIFRAKKSASISDLVLLVVDGNDLIINKPFSSINLELHLKNKGLLEAVKDWIRVEDNKITIVNKHVIILINKIDLISEHCLNELLKLKNVFCISCKTELGFKDFICNLSSHLELLCGSPSKLNPSYTQARHRFCINECLAALNRFSQYDDKGTDQAAQEIRNAVYSLGKITGRVTTEEILDVIFKDFCIGK